MPLPHHLIHLRNLFIVPRWSINNDETATIITSSGMLTAEYIIKRL